MVLRMCVNLHTHNHLNRKGGIKESNFNLQSFIQAMICLPNHHKLRKCNLSSPLDSNISENFELITFTVRVSMTEEGASPSRLHICIGQGLLFKETYVLVVDDHPSFTGGLVGAQVLVNTPITAPAAQHTATATVCGKNRK